MRFVSIWLFFAGALWAAEPAIQTKAPELTEALKNFRGDAPRAWSFVQTTVGEGKSTVERCDAARPEFDRWSLLEKDGRTPKPDELKDYADMRSRRSRGGTAPKITDQLNLATLEVVTDTTDRITYRCGIRPGEAGDKIAAFLRATLVIHKPTHTIESLEIRSIGEFAPNFGVNIAEMQTLLTYSLPTSDVPSLPQKVATRLRGRAFWVKSLDAELTVTFSGYEHVGKL